MRAGVFLSQGFSLELTCLASQLIPNIPHLAPEHRDYKWATKWVQGNKL